MATFTVPFNKEAASVTLRFATSCVDSAAAAVWGIGELYANDDVATFGKTADGGAWTASGTKKILGQFWYEAT